jgi:hypothetical protein
MRNLKRRWFKCRFSLVIFSCMLFMQIGMTQNSHYWGLQYGNKSLLLSGAVTGSVTDLGAVYYNPGFLALRENPAFEISAKVMQYNTIKVINGLGDGVDLKNSKFGSAPGMVAGTVKLKKLPKHKFAYSILTRRLDDIDLSYRTESTVDALVNFPGDELFIADVIWLAKAKEEWFGFTWSYAINPKISVGLSNFLSVSNFDSLLDIDLNALATDNHVVSFRRKRQLNYKHNGLLWKVGLAMDLSPVTLGLTVTTPKLNLSGSGFFQTEAILAGADPNYTIAKEDIFVTNEQNRLDAKLKSPWTVAVGAGFQLKKMVIHLNAEWFEKIDKYTVTKTEQFVGQSTGETLSVSLVEELNSVVNVGVGLELPIRENLSFYGSFATDFSAAKSDATWFSELKSEVDNAAFRADKFQIAGGASFELKKIEITLGTSFRFGKDEISRPVNLPDENNEPIFESGRSATLKFRNLKLLFGFSISLWGNDKQDPDKVEENK